MGLPDILLSLLRTPMSGTDLIRLFRGSIGHFWKTDLSQIYRALESLESQGKLISQSRPSGRGPARRVYELTDQGRARLIEWLRSPPQVPPAKFEYLAQLFTADADERPTERARQLLQSMRGEAAATVQVLQALDDQARRMPGYPAAMPAAAFYPWLTLRHGLLRRQAFLDWIDECLEHLAQRPESADQPDAPSLDELLRGFDPTDRDR